MKSLILLPATILTSAALIAGTNLANAQDSLHVKLGPALSERLQLEAFPATAAAGAQTSIPASGITVP